MISNDRINAEIGCTHVDTKMKWDRSDMRLGSFSSYSMILLKLPLQIKWIFFFFCQVSIKIWMLKDKWQQERAALIKLPSTV
ncbi:hypothetical protein [Holdemania massiliensis]|uniref:hypothetical protein n=1 Tax=Holdemania massiliensis TaxID=1468449 RepID=UPI0019D5A7B1|nr:hypothetical protein [Holdemania massiliensis]